MKKDTKYALSCFLVGFGPGLGLVLGLMIFFPHALSGKPSPYLLEKQKEYIAFHVDTTDFPMAVIDQMITVFEDNEVSPEAIVFVKNRKPVGQIRLGTKVIKSPEKKEEGK